VSARDRLARIFGPDLLELLSDFIRDEVSDLSPAEKRSAAG